MVTAELTETRPTVDKHAAPVQGNAMVRALSPTDIAVVARLFQNTFRDGGDPPQSLAAYLTEVFLHHPWQSTGLASQVFVDEIGNLKGLIGVLPLHLRFRGKPLRAAVLGALMADDPKQNPLAGAKLLRSVIRGPQDLTISESANPLSRKMWELAGGVTLPVYSLSWIRVFRPAAFPIALAARRFPMARVAVPLAAPFDVFMNRFPDNPVSFASLPLPACRSIDVSVTDFARALPAFCQRYELRPDWTFDVLAWIMKHACTKEQFGDVRICLVEGRRSKIVGGFLYYRKPGGIGYVLNTFAEPGAESEVICSMLASAAGEGCVALRGLIQPEFLNALMRHHAFMFNRASMVVHSTNEELMATLRSGNALITGLAAEAWSKLIGGEFGAEPVNRV